MVTTWNGGTSHQLGKPLPARGEGGERDRRPIDDLFQLARLDAGIIEPDLDLISIAELIVDIAQEYRPIAERNGITLRLERDTEHSTVNADIRLTERAITNLLDNALRHTAAGGEIVVSIANDNGVSVRVSDDGDGIRPDDLPHVFDRGFRSTSTSRACPASSGLGLAIVDMIAKAHGGSAAYRDSELLGGACFSVPLPGRVISQGKPADEVAPVKLASQPASVRSL